jgi:hypothetical protein
VFCEACGVREILGFLRMWSERLGALCRNVFNTLYLWVLANRLGSMSFADFFTFLFVYFP